MTKCLQTLQTTDLWQKDKRGAKPHGPPPAQATYIKNIYQSIFKLSQDGNKSKPDQKQICDED